MTTVPSGIWPIDPNVTTGTDLATYLNAWMDAFQSMQASPTRPPLIAKGGVWAKTLGAVDIALMFYDGTTDHEIGSVIGGNVKFGGVSASATAPTPATLGQTWVDTTVAGAPTLRIYNGTSWAYVSDKLLFGGATKAEATATGITVTGTLNVANITDGTDTVKTGFAVNGSARAWCNYDSSTGSIRDSFSISSIANLGASTDALNFAAHMANANHGVSGTSNGSTTTNNVGRYLSPYNYTASNVTITTQRVDNSASPAPMANVSIHGDLA